MRIHLTPKWSRAGRVSHGRTAAAALAVAAITGLSACSSGAPEGSSRAPASNPTSQEVGKHMAASAFSTAMDKPGTIVLDVRTPAEFASGHLPKAQNIDLNGADFATRIAALDKNATYAVYCHSGKRSNAAMEQMAAADFKHVYDLAGGIVAWQSMGGAMAMGRPQPSACRLIVFPPSLGGKDGTASRTTTLVAVALALVLGRSVGIRVRRRPLRLRPQRPDSESLQASLARFYIVPSCFLTTNAALRREAGGIPGGAGRTKEEFPMMGWYGNGMSWPQSLAMGVFWLILIGLIVWLVVRLLPSNGAGTTRNTGESALEILDRRLARGEIDQDAWQAQRAALMAAQGERM